MLQDRRIGKFSITGTVLNENPELVKGLMGQCLILRAEHHFATNTIDYVAQCDDFNELADGLEPPVYNIEVTMQDDDITVAWVLED